jgi:hypothetical protein
MTDAARSRVFVCDGKAWTVGRHATTQSTQTGLWFRRNDGTRFLVFTRGALPTDRELQSMGEEVLCVLLQRAVAR